MSKVAIDIIKLRDEEKQKAQGFWYNLWQDASELFFPREDQINTKNQPGEDKSVKHLDSTGIKASKKATSGLFGTIFPPGLLTYGLKIKNRKLAENPRVKEWARIATEISYEEIFGSNFVQHLCETIRSLWVFGTGCLFSEWDYKNGQLNFKDHAISTYTIKEDNHGNVDTVILSYKFTARQAVAEFGRENVSSDIIKAAEDLNSESKKFEFIRITRPRVDYNPLMKDNSNMPYECLDVDVKAKEVVREAGFMENPFHVARWEKGSTEKYGRCPGTDTLADARMLQKMMADFIHLCNVAGRPPLEVSSQFEGRVDLRPGAQNVVQQMDSIKGINKSALGEAQVVWQAIQEQRKVIEDSFYVDVFQPVSNVEGTHRTQFEFQQRVQEALKQLALPEANIQSELLSPCIMRSILLLIRWGRIPLPPMELLKITGRSKTSLEVEVDAEQLGIEYTGPLALALRNQQATGFQSAVSFAASLAQLDPSVMDTLNLDDGLQAFYEAAGVRSSTIATADQITDKRQARAKKQQAAMAMQQAEVASKAYKNTKDAAAEGSPAGELMGAAK